MEYYDVLNLNKDCSDNDIKKSYYKLARENHPDKVDESKREEATKKFQKIGEAYEILSDPEKRKIYDTYGKEGLKEGIKEGNDIFSMFKNFGFNFNNMNNMNMNNFNNMNMNNMHNNKNRKNIDTTHILNISLKDVYTGCIKKLKVTRKILVKKESGEKVDIKNYESSWSKCLNCHGNGIIMEQRQIGPNMISQTQKNCDKCEGKGFILLNSFEISEITDVIEIDITKGIKSNTSITFKNQGNFSTGSLPGDLIVIVKSPDKENDFIRNNNDLIYKKTISLADALCGNSFKIKTLDDRHISIPITDVITPGDKRIIPKEGINGGNLIISFDIEFPTTLSQSKKDKLRKILS
jgi:DnaJ homolog subfamily A member 2